MTATLPADPEQTHLHPHQAFQVPSTDLLGWCLQYRVRAYGFAGRPIPEERLREDLDCAVQYHAIHGMYWDRIGGLGRVYGTPGEPLPPTPAERHERALDEHEARQREQARRADDPDYDHTQDWVCDL